LRNKASQRVLEKNGSREKELFGKQGSSEGNGETSIFTAFSEKNGKNPRY
jgi:RimJ/RimL family protein N-acetyltransferase